MAKKPDVLVDVLAGTARKALVETVLFGTARKARKPLPKYFNADGTERPENKSERFRRLATDRLTKARKAILVIGNLSGAGYEFTDEQIAKIFDTLARDVGDTRERFNRAPKAKTDLTISL
jgi:hypothetical protein